MMANSESTSAIIASLPNSEQQNISRAKREWECTADALPQLICLLDNEGRVIRSNRTVERWSLGSVRQALGKSLHQVLHPGCTATNCDLMHHLNAAWGRLQNATLAEFETKEALEKTLHIELRIANKPETSDDLSTAAFAICIVSDITELKDAQEQLLKVNQQLEDRIRERTQDLMKANVALTKEIVQRQQAETSLLESRNGLHKLSVELMEAQETERKRIARDLHDTIGQSLSAIKYSLERAIQLQSQPTLGDYSNVLAISIEQVQRTLKEVRLISMNLRPSLLDDLGAVSAVRWLCREWGEIYTSTAIETRLLVADADIPDSLSTAIFRTVQEGLNNIARHSHARHVLVKMRTDAGSLIVEIADDGVGFDPEAIQRGGMRGNGLPGMRERVEHLGGHLKCLSRPGHGTFLQIGWPVSTTINQMGASSSCVQMQ
jgi:signal transduction histidine kinase